MLRAVADTHALIWYTFGDPRLSVAAKFVFEAAEANQHQIAFSSITFVEVAYLIEKGRLAQPIWSGLLKAVSDPNSIFIEVPVDRAIALTLRQVPRSAVPDMPDRIIAATALHLGVPLISRDRRISLSAVATVW